jgi:hypothetical protein
LLWFLLLVVWSVFNALERYKKKTKQRNKLTNISFIFHDFSPIK